MALTIVRDGLTYANCWNGQVRLTMKCTRPADFGRSSRRELGVRLTNIEGELNLEIAGYQLGEGEYGDGFNCLNVDGIVQHPRGDWSFRGKYCSIKALAALADWFDVVDAGQVPDVASVGGFTSHALSFAVLGSGLRTTYSHNAEFVPTGTGILRVTFGDSTQPPWENFEWVSMDFALSNLNLRAMSEEIRERLRAYPPR